MLIQNLNLVKFSLKLLKNLNKIRIQNQLRKKLKIKNTKKLELSNKRKNCKVNYSTDKSFFFNFDEEFLYYKKNFKFINYQLNVKYNKNVLKISKQFQLLSF